ncbi:hypothetical protein PHYSODRAFT_255233 [Phytophthora sojae]|uniref:Uncharacterized protein n=1 Tax=Phytophthora sojae (strain P6497) TaxID=1094619 RepID=G4YE91_PHYSP|nr:hypothetical protein PHYSODRAFT_255233 [Phytophthora sojae]EGZ26798.1 hypothetical protein PHYSODRAFT_255233 [Phytophthora sojae]|eukprot:XP_009514073.1 hypothetical protein PHYSODRAFT_255233 [Phytophthora sojae]
MALTSSQICSMLFTDVGNVFYKCTSCDKQYKKDNGYTNLLNHLRRNHDNYEQEAQEATRRQNPLRLRLYIVLIFELLEMRVARELPASFGPVLDGWTSGGRHYIVIFAVFGSDSTGITGGGADTEYYDDLECSSRRFLLLTFAPVEVEEDMGAQSQYNLIAGTLSRYNKPWSAVKFTVGDNCSVNQCIGRKKGVIPFIGCASHRFNLAVKDFLKTEDELIAKVHTLMTKLRTIKGRALLRRISHLSPLLRNDTRWSSTSTLALSAVRRLFDQVVKEYPALKSRLAATAPIVNNPHLDLGLVKLQREEALTAAEQSACAEFRSTALERAPAREDGNSSIVKAAFKKRKAPRHSQYVDVAYVPPTSNECEHFFSAAKPVLTDVRKSLSPTMLEMLMCLQYNRDLWDVNTVEQVRARIGSN